MRWALCAMVIAFVVVGATGCAGFYKAPVQPGMGLLFSEFRAPMDHDAQETDFANMKKGEATAESILGWFAIGDASIQAAAESAKINKVAHVDYQFWNILGVYSKFTTIVYGE